MLKGTASIRNRPGYCRIFLLNVPYNLPYNYVSRYSDRKPASMKATSGVDIVNPAFDPKNDKPIFSSDEERVYEKIESGKAADEENEYAEIPSSQRKDIEVLYDAAD